VYGIECSNRYKEGSDQRHVTNRARTRSVQVALDFFFLAPYLESMTSAYIVSYPITFEDYPLDQLTTKTTFSETIQSKT
jgi:hypothetical protein